MSQYDFGTINATTKSGTALATDLNSWRNALHSMHSGTTRPSYAVAGTMWIDTTGSPWLLKVYDGADDIQIGSIDTAANTFEVSIAAGAITSTELAAGAVTADKIARATANLGFTPVTDTSTAGAVTFDFSTGNITKITLSENITAITLSGATAGDTLKIWVTQAAGLYTMSGWPANVKWAGGTAPTITATDASVDIVTLEYDGTNYYAAATQDHR